MSRPVSPAVRRTRRCAALLTAVLCLPGCSPTFNWRDLRPAGTPLQALMPCKPDTAERSLPLAGTVTTLHMNSCEAGGLTFAVAWAGLPDDSLASPALEDWRRGTLATLRVDATKGADPSGGLSIDVPGAGLSLPVQASGQGPGGETVRVQAVYFSKGLQVYQAAIYGSRLPPEVLATFFEGLRLP